MSWFLLTLAKLNKHRIWSLTYKLIFFAFLIINQKEKQYVMDTTCTLYTAAFINVKITAIPIHLCSRLPYRHWKFDVTSVCLKSYFFACSALTIYFLPVKFWFERRNLWKVNLTVKIMVSFFFPLNKNIWHLLTSWPCNYLFHVSLTSAEGSRVVCRFKWGFQGRSV